MENATKALLIGAGMLFAVVVVSMVLYTYNQITTYYNSKQDEQERKQQSEFNIEFSAYDREITGFELVSLINKIINYNRQNAFETGSTYSYENADKNWTPMYIEFTLTSPDLIDGTRLHPQLFTETTYNSRHQSTENELYRIIQDMNALENRYGAGVMSKLAATDVDNLDVYLTQQEMADKEANGISIKTIKEILGKDIPNPVEGQNIPYKDDVIRYEQYINFKRADFDCRGRDYDPNTSRLINLIYVQI